MTLESSSTSLWSRTQQLLWACHAAPALDALGTSTQACRGSKQNIRNGDIDLEKVLGKHNPADALTKCSTGPEIAEHMKGLGLAFEQGRAASAPRLVQNPCSYVCVLSRWPDLVPRRCKSPTSVRPRRCVEAIKYVPSMLGWTSRRCQCVSLCSWVTTAR